MKRITAVDVARATIIISVILLPLLIAALTVVALRAADKNPVRSAQPSSVVAPSATTTVLSVVEVTAKPLGDPVALATLPSEEARYTRGLSKAVLSPGRPGAPYSYHLVATTPEYSADCGFFTTVQEGGWRVAFCLDSAGKRVARKLYLLSLGDQLGIVVAGEDYGFFDLGENSGT